MDDTSPRDFSSELRRFQHRWRSGLLLAGCMRALLWVGTTLLLFGICDYYLSFSDSARRTIGTILTVVAICGVLWTFWDVFLFLRREAATAADRALGSNRNDILSALELLTADKGPEVEESALSHWLRSRAVANAARQMATLQGARAFPRRAVGRIAKNLSLFTFAFGVITITAPEATWTITRRLLQPNADIPPYTRLKFTLGPMPAEVLYGGELVVTAEITGDKLKETVRCLTRDPVTGTIEDSPVFIESSNRFSRKFEKVAVPVDVAFATGKARSAWLPVSVRMQPKIQDVLLTVEPPVYSGLPRRDFAIGTQELISLPGSRVTARITSNRPLGGGILKVQPAGTNDPAQEVAAVPETTHRVRFTWAMRQASRITVEIRDVLGTASEPVQLEQKVSPDERPQVVLRQPAGDVLATPESELPLEVTASDDLGLTRMTLVRQLRGYRERSSAQSIQTGERRHEIRDHINLAAFGLVPGQTIELTAEAGDTNPNLLGVTVSEPARIHIIAREQYAQMLRDQVTLEDFAGRYTALRDAMEEVRKSLEELEKAAQSGDAQKTEEARKKALDAHRKAGQTFGQIAKDFPLFELDQSLANASENAMKELFENMKELEEHWRAQPQEMMESLPGLKERLGRSEEDLAQEMEKGNRALAAANVFEQAGRFREKLEEQRNLAKDFNRTIEQIRRGEIQAGQALQDLARRQEEIANGLRKMENELEGALNALPEEFAEMREEGRKFIEGLQELEIAPTMEEAATAAKNNDGKAAGDRASEALAKMEALLRRKNGFSEMSRGEGENGNSFSWPQDLSQTLEQLMRSLIQKRGMPGEGKDKSDKPAGGTSGSGFGGFSDSGFAMKGKMPRLPIYGPPRTKFSQRATANPELSGGNQQGSGSGSGRPESGAEVEADEVSTKPTHEQRGEALAAELVPEAYREAVKRYFSSDDNQRAESTPNTQSSKP